MQDSIDLVPPAGALIQSLRSIGYTFNSAVADIVDNSVDAKASRIEIEITPGDVDQFSVSICDDGHGMSFEELKQAMSLGSKSPEFTRKAQELGRFGMGLKTASFSQAKILSVITRRAEEEWVGLRWDLDHVAKTNHWSVKVLGEHGIKSILDSMANSGALKQGTIVRWEQCDRLIPEGSDSDVRDKIYKDTVYELQCHLGLIFHKFLGPRGSAELLVNQKKLEPSDPFCVSKGKDAVSSTLSFEEQYAEKSPLRDAPESPITVKGFLIPHPDRFRSKEALFKVAPHGDFIASQGVYVYRGGRLLSWGDWHRIVPRDQSNRLARVEVNIPNSLDLSWRLDIKKSKVELPTLFRNWLKPKIQELTGQSQKNHKGRITNPRLNKNPVWVRNFDRSQNAVSYEINKKHALVETMSKEIKGACDREFKALMQLIECSLPADQISNDIGARVTIGINHQDEELPNQVKDLLVSLVAVDIDTDVIVRQLALDPAFSDLSQSAVVKFIEQLTG